MKKKHNHVLLSLLIIVSILCCSFSVSPQTASAADSLNWKLQLWSTSDDWNYHPTSTQVLSGNHLYSACEDKLFKVDKNTGATQSTTLAAPVYDSVSWTDNYGYLVVSDSMLFVPLINGRIQAFSLDTLSPLWITTSIAGFYNDAPSYYNDGVLYTTVNNSDCTQGKVIAYDVSDQNTSTSDEAPTTKWSTSFDTGFYWTEPTLVDHQLILASQDGHIFYLMSDTGAKISSISTEEHFRSGFAKTTDSLYITSTKGTLYQLSQTGSITKKISLSDSVTNCTTTPTICNNRLYVFSAGKVIDYTSTGLLSILDTNLNLKYQCKTTAESKSKPLVLSGEAENRVFFTQNNTPGGLYCLTDSLSKQSGTVSTLYEPKDTDANYCMSQVISDGKSIFYSNDSGILFSVAIPVIQATPTPSASPTTTPTTTPVLTPTTTPLSTITPATSTPVSTIAPVTRSTQKKPARITKLKAIKGKKNGKRTRKITLSWKAQKNISRYEIFRKKKTAKKYKKIVSLKKNKTTLSLQKGTYGLKVRAVLKSGKQTTYGSFSKVLTIRL